MFLAFSFAFNAGHCLVSFTKVASLVIEGLIGLENTEVEQEISVEPRRRVAEEVQDRMPVEAENLRG